jgi:CRISPR/Cas system-associated protein Cas10 (large subunit of type III CRISPR-Cas system)
MSDLRERIAKALFRHSFEKLVWEDESDDLRKVLLAEADAVIAELHPTRTCALCGRKGTQKFRAYRDGWVCQSIHACNRRKARR